jgi:hypothetical protein
MALNDQQVKAVTNAILALLDSSAPSRADRAKELFVAFGEEVAAKKLVSGAPFWITTGNSITAGNVQALGLK